MSSIFIAIGKYVLLLKDVFSRPEKLSVYRRQTLFEMDKLGVQSLGLVALLSLFMGAVITLQTAAQIESPWVPSWTVGFTTRQTMILEFSPTIISLILAGKVGSNIASEIGTMRVTEQIDALEIIGINSASYLILPKLIATIFIFPLLILMSMFLGIGAGAAIGAFTDVVTMGEYEEGLHLDFKSFTVFYAIIKTVVFAFCITTLSAFQGYYATGGALQVGKASTSAVVNSSIVILIFNLILTKLLLL